MYKEGSDDAAALYERNGKLIEYGVQAGCHHGHYFQFSKASTPATFNAFANVFRLHLCRSTKENASAKVFTGPAFKCKGKMDDDLVDDIEQELAMMNETTREMMTHDFVVDTMRPAVSATQDQYEAPEYAEYLDGCNVETVEGFGGPAYHERAITQTCYIHKAKGSTGIKPCVVYYHGGGGWGGDAREYFPLVNRMAMEADVTIISCNYGLAPERPAPLGILDAYACLKDVLKNHAKYGIDPSRTCIAGESGGGYITAGVGLVLAERDESHQVKFQFQMIPMVTERFMKDDPKPPKSKIEKASTGFHQGIADLLRNGGASLEDHWIWPNLAPDSLVKKAPPAVIYTCEYDMYKEGSDDAAALYERNGKLIEYGVQAGCHHGHYFQFSKASTPATFNAFANVFRLHLC